MADEDDSDYELPLSDEARFEVQLGTTFTYRGLSHWPKVIVADGMIALPVQGEEGAEPVWEAEGADSLQYRVETIAHIALDRVIARMKRSIDARYEADQAARAATQAAKPAHENEESK